MKLITPTELIELLPADGSLLDSALARFETFTPTFFREPGFCKEAVSEGWLTPLTVSSNGIPAFVIAYHTTGDGGLWIDIAQTLDAGADISILNAGIDALAKQERSRYVRMTTARRGLVKIAQSYGYRPEAVLLTKGCPC